MKKIFKFFCFFLFFYLFAFSQNFIPSKKGHFPHPDQTELVEIEDKSTNKKSLSTISYKYVTELSSSDIISFYRSLFTELGFREVKEESKKDVLFFSRGLIQQVILLISEPLKSYNNKRIYYIDLLDLQDILSLSELHFQKPYNRNFIPILDGSTEGLWATKANKPTPIASSAIYLSHKDFDTVKEFYLNNMPKKNWELKKNIQYEGRRNFFYILCGDPHFIKIFSDVGINIEELYPGIEVNIKSASLSYERRNESCFVYIIEFRDSAEVLKSMRINPQPLEKYGRTVIFINKADKTIKEIEESAYNERHNLKTLKNFLGY